MNTNRYVSTPMSPLSSSFQFSEKFPSSSQPQSQPPSHSPTRSLTSNIPPPPISLSHTDLQTLTSYGSLTIRSFLPLSIWTGISLLLCILTMIGLGVVGLTGIPLGIGNVIGKRRRVVEYWVVVGDLQIGVGSWGWGVNDL